MKIDKKKFIEFIKIAESRNIQTGRTLEGSIVYIAGYFDSIGAADVGDALVELVAAHDAELFKDQPF